MEEPTSRAPPSPSSPSSPPLASTSTSKKYLFPYEIFEPNWRFWTFLAVLVVGIYVLIAYPVNTFSGYIDPFYSPTVLIVPIPGLFRLTCYAYRKDYHRHLFRHPLGCETKFRDEKPSTRKYTGERNSFFQFENLHRYFLYAGIMILPFFFYDVYYSITFSGGIVLRVGSFILLANAFALTAWTLSCHAFRHLIGGNIDCYSCVPGGSARKSIFNIQSWWNSHHEGLAWISLLTFFFADLYLRGLAAGLPLDFTIFKA